MKINHLAPAMMLETVDTKCRQTTFWKMIVCATKPSFWDSFCHTKYFKILTVVGLNDAKYGGLHFLYLCEWAVSSYSFLRHFTSSISKYLWPTVIFSSSVRSGDLNIWNKIKMMSFSVGYGIVFCLKIDVHISLIESHYWNKRKIN